MEVSLYNSTVCRLCGEENDSGTLLYSPEENSQNLSEIINTYLPLKVFDDGQLPRTICPGCTIQLEATVEFMNLIINGQKIIRELHNREKEYKKTILKSQEEDEDVVITEELVYEINSSDGVYNEEHPVALQMAGLEKPKRKRGRPPKKAKSPEEIAKEVAERQSAIEAKQHENEKEVPGKRRRKTPTRYREAVQGKELERIFKEEGVTDGDESDNETKPERGTEEKPTPPKEPEVIGHMETSGELVVVVKGKGRGRPKGRMRQKRQQCAICGVEFSSVGRYMAHVAQHGPVVYRCDCEDTFATRLAFQEHQQVTGHEGQTVISCKTEDSNNDDPEPKEETQPTIIIQDPLALPPELVAAADLPMTSLPDLSDTTDAKDDTTEFIKSLVSDKEPMDEAHSVEEGVNKVERAGTINNENGTEPPTEQSEESTVVTDEKGKVKLKCPQCDKMFSSKQSKSMHIKAVHQGEKPYVCAECGVRFAYPRSLALHRHAHRNHRAAKHSRYACDLCGKVLNHPSSVVYHKQAEHAGQRYVCSKCGKGFKHRQLLQRHQLVHSQLRPYSCKTCNASFKTKANLINHQLLHTGVKRFSCEICKHRFAHKTSLTLHMRWHSGSKPYVCNVCGKSFSQRGNLSEHERIHTGEKPFQCSICSRRFTTSSQYRLHARRHQPDRQIALGTKRVAKWSSRSAVLASNTNSTPTTESPPAPLSLGAARFICGVCGRAFAQQRTLARHSRRHASQHVCKHCSRAFADAGTLQRHTKQVHKQISLLVTDKSQQSTLIKLADQEDDAEEDTFIEVTEVDRGEDNDLDERVIYVTYDVGESEPAFHILDPEQAANIEAGKVVTECSLYPGPSLLVPQPTLQPILQPLQPTLQPLQPLQPILQTLQPLQPLQLSPQIVEQSPIALDSDDLDLTESHIAVTDEQGNPLHFTMSDGTQLAITSADGKSLQVITEDGQTIPVEINGFNAEEEEQDDYTVTQLELSKDMNDGSAHYYTIV